jgi:hypothetical protein
MRFKGFPIQRFYEFGWDRRVIENKLRGMPSAGPSTGEPPKPVFQWERGLRLK